MNSIFFILLSTIYLISLAVVDGLFNRLVFRKDRRLSYFSPQKKAIYTLWEWRAIGAILLVFLPIVLPTVVSYLAGGIPSVTLYWIVLLLIPWDMIFGAIVFDDWFGDRPSIALPYIGWKNFSLLGVMVVRILLACLLMGVKITFSL